jgi:hypothetical protein
MCSILEDYSTDQVCRLLEEQIKDIDADTVEGFRKNRISGKAFLALKEEDIKEIGCTLGERKSLLYLIESYKVNFITEV